MLAAAAATVIGVSTYGQNVVISQVYGGGGATTGTPTYTHDYVELLNTGPAPVDINGWSVQYASSTGSTWSGAGLTVLATTPTVLQPGQYFLVRLGTATGALGAALPVTPDATGTTAMSATSGKIALVNNSTALTGTCPTGVVDFVGYGTTANCREPFSSTATADNAPAPTSSAYSLVRLLDGCYDSNRNRFDFVNVLNAVPRNSASTFASCGAATDLSIGVTGGAACPSTIGASATYTFTVTNLGMLSSDATVTVTIPAGFNFVSSVPAGTLSMGVLTVPVGAILPGGSANVQVNVTLAAVGSYALTGSVSGTAVDPVTINDTVVSAPSYVPGSGTAIKGVFSNLAGAANSTVPTGVSAPAQFFFTTSTSQDVFGRPWMSSDGRYMIFKAKNNLGTSLDDMLVRVDTSTNTADVIAQEGATDLGGGELLGVIDAVPTINTAGDVAYSAETSAPTTADDVVVKYSGGTHTVIAREGEPDGFGGTVTVSVTAWSILDNGDVAWGHLLSSTPANDQEVIILDSAAGSDSIIARANDGVTTPAPTNQVGGATNLWKLFNSGSDFSQVSAVSPDGMNVLLHGDLEAGATDPDAIAVNGAIVAMDGQTVAGANGTITTISSASLRGSNWIAYGSNSTGDDWVLHNGNVVARDGAPIFTGATETFGNPSFTATFFMAAANAVGDYIVGGVTNAADVNANAVLVLNGTTIVARENDPVDLDGNGVFDDDAFIRTFRDDRIYLTDDRKLYFAIETRNTAGYCSGNAKTADVLVMIDLNPPAATGACCAGATCSIGAAASCTGPNTAYAGDGTVCNVYPAATSPCCFADYNHVGGITVQDIFDFLAGYFGGNAIADINGGGLSVQDIFDFLATYFSGGC
jgi:uncharacterized repeat protein (TIGR01451 family)